MVILRQRKTCHKTWSSTPPQGASPGTAHTDPKHILPEPIHSTRTNRPQPRPVVTAPATAANSRCCAMANVSGFACTGVREPTTPETSRIMAPAPIRCSAPPPTLQSFCKRVVEPACVRLHELQDRLASPARGSVGRRSRMRCGGAGHLLKAGSADACFITTLG